MKKPPVDLEGQLMKQILDAGLPEPERQCVFARGLGRRWRFDFSFPRYKLAIEVQGGTFLPGGGGHTRGQGAENDCVKAAVASLMGWQVVAVNTHMVADGRALYLIASFLDGTEGAAIAAAHIAAWKCKACDVTKTRRLQRARDKARKAKG